MMAAKITMTAATVQRQQYEIPYPRVGLYDVEQRYKDSMSIDKYMTMVEEKDSTIVITTAWEKGDEKTAKLVGDTITITDGDKKRVYAGISEEQIKSFYTVAKATKNGGDNFDSIKMQRGSMTNVIREAEYSKS